MTNKPNSVGEEIDKILTSLENIVAMDSLHRYSGVGGDMSPKHYHAKAKLAITTLLDQKVKEAYKKGYIDGGIDQLTKENKDVSR